MSELLRAEDAERESSASYWQAVYGNVLTFADLEYAVGTLSAEEQGDLQ